VNKLLVGNKSDLTANKVVSYETAKVILVLYILFCFCMLKCIGSHHTLTSLGSCNMEFASLFRHLRMKLGSLSLRQAQKIPPMLSRLSWLWPQRSRTGAFNFIQILPKRFLKNEIHYLLAEQFPHLEAVLPCKFN